MQKHIIHYTNESKVLTFITAQVVKKSSLKLQGGINENTQEKQLLFRI